MDDRGFHERELIAEATRERQLHEDLQNEAAGRETGRAPRSNTLPGDTPRERERKKREADRAELTRLQVLLADPEYRALYEDTKSKLSDARERTDQALLALSNQLGDIDEKLDRLGPDAVGTERYERLQEERLRIQQRQQDWLDYQLNVLDPAQERLEDQDNPPSKEELERIQDEIERREPAAAMEIAAPQRAAVQEPNPTFMTDKPTL